MKSIIKTLQKLKINLWMKYHCLLKMFVSDVILIFLNNGGYSKLNFVDLRIKFLGIMIYEINWLDKK